LDLGILDAATKSTEIPLEIAECVASQVCRWELLEVFFYYLERVYWNISILHVLLQLFAIRSFQMLVFLKVLGFTMEGANNPICRWSVGRLHSSLKHFPDLS